MRRLAALAPIALVAILVAACGDARPAGPPPREGAGFPVTIEASNGPVTIPARPVRIVSLSPTATEMLFAIGAGPQVVAVDELSNYPASAPRTALSGFEPNVEAVASYRPDLVVFATDAKDLAASLRRLGITALQQPAAATLDDTYRQIADLGRATGHASEAEALVDRMRADIRRIVSSAPAFDEPPTYYHELDSTYFSATSKTFIGSVYSLLGLRNIADAADSAGSGYPQLSAEYIIQADPDLIFLADTKCCGQTPQTVARRPGWGTISAVRNGTVFALDDDIASRWGPRIVDFLRTIADALRALERAA